MNHDNKLSFAEKLGYGMGDAACGIVYSSVTMFLTWFYTDIYGLSAAAVGVMFLVTRVRTLCRAGGNDLHDSGIWRIG